MIWNMSRTSAYDTGRRTVFRTQDESPLATFVNDECFAAVTAVAVEIVIVVMIVVMIEVMVMIMMVVIFRKIIMIGQLMRMGRRWGCLRMGCRLVGSGVSGTVGVGFMGGLRRGVGGR